ASSACTCCRTTPAPSPRSAAVESHAGRPRARPDRVASVVPAAQLDLRTFATAPTGAGLRLAPGRGLLPRRGRLVHAARVARDRRGVVLVLGAGTAGKREHQEKREQD